MSNIEHSTITDPNIHEPKGIATASLNTVYIANGSGSGTWESGSALFPNLSPFSGNFKNYYTDYNKYHTYGLTVLPSNFWTAIPLVAGYASGTMGTLLSDSTFALPAGSYFVTGVVGGFTAGANQATAQFCSRLYNVTNTTDVLTGSIEMKSSIINGSFTLSGTKTMSVQILGEANDINNNFVNWALDGASITPALLTSLNIWKI